MSETANLQNLLAALEKAGRRITPQRTAVCIALLTHGGHPTASDIWQNVQATHPSISQATVYNTLAALAELQLIRALDIVGDEHTHYDLDVAPHVNIVCTSCSTIDDVYTDSLEALLGLVATRSGYVINHEDGVIVYGLCPNCAKQNGSV